MPGSIGISPSPTVCQLNVQPSPERRMSLLPGSSFRTSAPRGFAQVPKRASMSWLPSPTSTGLPDTSSQIQLKLATAPAFTVFLFELRPDPPPSVIKTLNEALSENPAASVAVQSTVVVPSGNELPDAGSQVTTGFASAMSVAVATKVTLAPSNAVISAGTVRTGGVVSTTATVKLVDAVRLPLSGTVVHVTVVLPKG